MRTGTVVYYSAYISTLRVTYGLWLYCIVLRLFTSAAAWKHAQDLVCLCMCVGGGGVGKRGRVTVAN